MSFSPTSGQVVLQEVFDEGSIPTDEEICDYALRIGIDVENEPHLLYLARDGLMQALPSGWKPCYDKDKKEIYYFNFKTKKAQWEHPLDEVFRNLVTKARTEGVLSEQIDDDSRTSIKEDLKSYEEASLSVTTNEMSFKPKKLEPISPLGKSLLKKFPATLSPIKKINVREGVKNDNLKSGIHIYYGKLLQKSETEGADNKIGFDETEVRKRPNSSDIRNRRNIEPLEFRQLSKQEIIPPPAREKINFKTEGKKLVNNKIFTESQSVEIKGGESTVVTKDEGYGTEFSVSSLGEKDTGGKKELTLAGGGSIFLKSNKMKFSPSSDLVTSSLSREELSDGLLSPDGKKLGHEFDSHPKSILRDQTILKVNEKSVDSVEKKVQKEDLDDEKKSVRFHLEKELQKSEIPSVGTPRTESQSVLSRNNTFKFDNKLSVESEKKTVRQVEVDFEELNISLSDDKVVKAEHKMAMENTKATESKKFKSSQMLVNEFREIFDTQPKNNINLFDNSIAINAKNATVKSSHIDSNSSRSLTSQSDDDANHTSQEVKYAVNEATPVEQTEKSCDLDLNKVEHPKSKEKLSSKIFDSTYDDLVEFTIKKKLGLDASKNSDCKSNILYHEGDFLLEDILKATDSDSVDDNVVDKLFMSQDKELEYLEKLESQIHLNAQKRRQLEQDIGNSEKLKNDKQNELEREYKLWLKDTEESYKEKKVEASNGLREKYEIWLKEKEVEFEKSFRQKYESETEGRLKDLKNELMQKAQSEIENMKTQFEEEQKNRLRTLQTEMEAQESKELDSLKKSFESMLQEKKTELMMKHNEEIKKIENNLEDLLSEQKSQKLKELELVRENEALIETMRSEMKESYQKQKNSLLREHELLLENMKREHSLAVEQLRIEFRNKEDSLKTTQMNRLEEIKFNAEEMPRKKELSIARSAKADNAESRVFEKVRCEKRLLEDKYKTLKEKYIKLKAEAKSTLERKKKKKESSITMSSETEKSSSYKAILACEKSNVISSKQESKQEKETKPKNQMNQLEFLQHDISTDEENLLSSKNLSELEKISRMSQARNEESHLKIPSNTEKIKEDLFGEEKKTEGNEIKKKKQLFSRFKAASTSKINSSNKNNSKEVLSPVENLRRQLKKLEELEDQFPLTTNTDTYMRYPFTDNAQFGSSEIEFFKHRIHLERESVRRAKDSLKAQKKCFENRQKEVKQKLVECEPGSKASIEQIYQEEKELTDMEVSVYRTRALLGEKIIRLRHLEQSLKRISQPMKKGKDLLGRLGVKNIKKDEDRTLSDLSSYSGSSGLSNTEFNDGNNPAVNAGIKKNCLEQNRRYFRSNMQESSEIIQSLENLNSEIREIWEVLKKQHQSGQETITMLPPPPLIYGDLGWSGFSVSSHPFRNTVITSTSNLQRPIAQQFKTQVTGTSNTSHVSTIIDSSLVDRTRSLRDWLKAARNSTPLEAVSSSQVTL
ncbi:hypothetical protein RUM44_004515 [Polyplax serrata]|uniref:WW domain-containing protein n=1 Tax=Polyplax serrata TaxID=468196 RepID=A0ABR1B335_POLSC